MDAQIEEVVTRIPKQERSRASLERIFAATEALLIECDGDQFTLADVSAKAGIAVGSITYRFASRDNLIIATLNRTLDRIIAQEAAMIDRAKAASFNFDSFVMSFVGEFAEFLRSNGPPLRQVMRRAASDPDLGKRGQAAVKRGGDLAHAAFLEWQSSFGGTDPVAKVRTIYHMIFSTLSRQLGVNILGEPAFFQDLEELKRDLGHIALAYLRSPY